MTISIRSVQKQFGRYPALNNVDLATPWANYPGGNPLPIALKKDMAIEVGRSVITAATAAAVMTKLQQLSAGFVYDSNRQTVVISPHKLDVLEDIFEENQRAPTLVWYQFKAELAALQARDGLLTQGPAFRPVNELFSRILALRPVPCVGAEALQRMPLLAVHFHAALHGADVAVGSGRG